MQLGSSPPAAASYLGAPGAGEAALQAKPRMRVHGSGAFVLLDFH
jgi:hypothetical protein